MSAGHGEKRGQTQQSEEVEELAGIRLEADTTSSDAYGGQQYCK